MVKLGDMEKYEEFFHLLKVVVDKAGEVTLEPDDLLTVESAIVTLKAIVGEETPAPTE